VCLCLPRSLIRTHRLSKFLSYKWQDLLVSHVSFHHLVHEMKGIALGNTRYSLRYTLDERIREMYLHQFKTSKSCLKRVLRVPRQVVTTSQILLSIWELALELQSSLLVNKDFASANRRHIFLERLVCIPLIKHLCVSFLFLVVLAG
jgi:uncharacterized membrane protein